MAYYKIDLKEPIYELQNKETERQHYFAERYYEISDDNITKFIKSLINLKKGQIWDYEGSNVSLLFNPPKQSTFVKWAACLQYKKRRKAYWDNKFKEMREERKQKADDCGHTLEQIPCWIKHFKGRRARLTNNSKKHWNKNIYNNYT